MNEQVAKRVLAKIQGFLNKKHSWGRFILRWQPGVHSVLPLGGHSEGNRYTLYTTGDDAFAAKWESIKKAKEKVWCSVYTIEPDRVGQHTVDLLVQAKKRGCRVILLYDYIGSHRISHNFLEPLYSVGAECIQFSPIHVTRYESWRNGIFRSHQKLLIADEHGFCGGMNISEDYAGLNTLGKDVFCDTHIKIEGPAVKDLELAFLNSLLSQHPFLPLPQITIDLESYIDERPALTIFPEDVFIQVLQSGVRKKKRGLHRAFRNSLRSATEHCYISSPYFLPPKRVKKALQKVARRKVPLHIITCGISDVFLMNHAQQHIYSSYLKRGIRIYEMWDKKLHAKMATIDGFYSYIGSFNLDAWSYSNLELNVFIVDHLLAQRLEERFLELIKNSCKEVLLADLQKRSPLAKAGHWICFRIFKLLSPTPNDSDTDSDSDPDPDPNSDPDPDPSDDSDDD